jgi:integrase
MIFDMTKIRLRFIQQYVDRHGKLRYYFRRGNQRGPLPGLLGSDEFMRAYGNYLGTEAIPTKTVLTTDRTFGRLVLNFYASRAFKDVKASSQKTYRNVLEPLAKVHGHRAVADLNRKQAEKLLHDIGLKKPAMANLTKSVLKLLFEIAIKEEWREDNPFVGIEPFKSGTFHTWNEGELRQFEQHWPLGTRERLAYELLLQTGQRVGDVAKMRRQDIVNGELHVIQQKTGAELYLPVVPELELALRAYPVKGMALIGDRDGKPISVGYLSEFMREAINEAGLPGRCKPHGLRKAAMRRLAELGRSEKQIAAVSGHKSLREVQRYTEAASQRLLAQDAMKR